LHYFVLVFNGSDLLAVTGRDKDATWRTTGTLRREFDWSKRRLLQELENGLPYRTIPRGWTIDWSDYYLWRHFNVEASEISIPYGTVSGAIAPPPPKTHLGYEEVILGIEVLPPGTPADAEVPPPSAPAPAGSPPPPKMVSEAALRDAVRVIVETHPPGTLPLDEEEFHRRVETQLGVQIARDRFLAARDDVAPHFKRRVGRPRKSEQ
jgi:hypothetical protein